MRRIDISTKKYPGTFAIVDDADFANLSRYVWTARAGGGTLYASRVEGPRGSQRWIHMHQAILGEMVGREIDHRDGNGLNNTRWNLRFATKAQNAQNQRRRKGSRTSAYKGVSWNTRAAIWVAQIAVNGVKKNLGQFNSEIEAAKVYDAVAAHHFGEFAALNFQGPPSPCPDKFLVIVVNQKPRGGVTPFRGKYQARLTVEGKRRFLGCFATYAEAAEEVRRAHGSNV